MKQIKWFPRSLFGRNVMLLVALILIVQLTMFLAFYQIVQKPRSEQMASYAATYIELLQTALTNLSEEQRIAYIAQFNRKDGVQIEKRLQAGADIDAAVLSSHLTARPLVQALNPVVYSFLDELRAKIPAGAEVYWRVDGKPEVWMSFPVQQEMYWFKISGERFTRAFSGIGLILTLLYGVFAFGVAYLIQRRINQPLRELALAAEQIGQGATLEPLPEDVPSEIATVSRSFNQMARNLENLNNERAVMLAGVSHDLRTPLTKLQLGVAMLTPDQDEDLKQGMIRHIEQINTIIEQFVDFARNGSEEVESRFDLNEMMMNLASEFVAQGTPFAVDLVPLPPMTLRPVAIHRMVSNLMRNAALYGKQDLMLRTRIDAEFVSISILDRGPGIPLDEVERLKQPFTRLDTGRALISGSGLGLAIAERVAQLHGGSLQLLARFEGGLEALIRLPHHLPPNDAADVVNH